MDKIQVAVVMGSDSDLPVMQGALKMLEKFGIGFVVEFFSAHRTPRRPAAFISEAAQKGVKVIIAGASGAAHLPGVIAAETYLPVIGVPLRSRISIDGIDSLYSICQMPPGIPVATVGIDATDNAGILAAQIIGVFDKGVALKLENHKKEMARLVQEKNEKLQSIGYKKYLSEK